MRGLLMQGSWATLGTSLVVLFFLLFCGLIWRVYRKGARAEMDRASRLPIEE